MHVIRCKFAQIPRYLVLWTNLKNAEKQLPGSQLLPAKYVSSTHMYELKDYQEWIWLKIVCRESFVILGANLPKFLDIWYYGKTLKWCKAETRRLIKLLLAKYVSSTLMFKLKEYQQWVWLIIVCRESCM